MRMDTQKEIFVSEAPCAHAITLIPARPSVPKSLPAIPVVRFIFSPTISEDGQILEVVDETTGINAYGQARDDLIEAIRDDIDAIWLNYAHPSLPLAAEAAALGEWWRNNAKILSEGQQ